MEARRPPEKEAAKNKRHGGRANVRSETRRESAVASSSRRQHGRRYGGRAAIGIGPHGDFASVVAQTSAKKPDGKQHRCGTVCDTEATRPSS
jgi:hypothetical protein